MLPLELSPSDIPLLLKGQKQHIHFSNINFSPLQHRLFAPHPKSPILAPPKEVDVPLFLQQDAKRGPMHFFWGDVDHKLRNHLYLQGRAWTTEVECQTPARSTSPTSCSTGPALWEFFRKVLNYREKAPGVQGKRRPKYRYCFSCNKVRGGSSPSKLMAKNVVPNRPFWSTKSLVY